MKKLSLVVILLCGLPFVVWGAPAVVLPSYRSQPVSLPLGARYVQKNGVVRIYGAAKLKTVIERLNVEFLKTHPGLTFNTDRMKGSNVGIPGLTFDVTPFAPLDRPYTEWEMTGYEKVVGASPLELRAADIGKHSTDASAFYFYLRNTPGKPVDEFIREYFRLVFSAEGQDIVASSGFKPLSATAAAAELAKVTGGSQ